MDSAADMIRYYLARLVLFQSFLVVIRQSRNDHSDRLRGHFQEILAGLCSGVAVSEAAAEAERNSAAEKVEFIASGSATAIEYIMVCLLSINPGYRALKSGPGPVPARLAWGRPGGPVTVWKHSMLHAIPVRNRAFTGPPGRAYSS